MNIIRRRIAVSLVCCLAGALVAGAVAGHAGQVIIDVCPAGTTSNQNVYGTVLSGGGTIATWPDKAAYRDYQFQLSTTSGTTSFDEFGVRLSAQRRNGTSATSANTLRASLWTGVITPNPILADALTTVTIPNSAVSGSGYNSVLLTGLTFPSELVSTTPSTYFFRVWAEGDSSNGGFQTKMAKTVTELTAVTMQETVPVDGYIGVDDDQDGDFEPAQPGNDYYDFISYSTGVPEIDASGLGSVVATVTGALGLLERRRKAARPANGGR